MARYRKRTFAREHLPATLSFLAPKGQDCEDHEWYRVESGEFACYHCEQTAVLPFAEPELSVEKTWQRNNSSVGKVMDKKSDGGPWKGTRQERKERRARRIADA